MNKVPQHKSSLFFDFGVVLHPISSEMVGHAPIKYAHQDDYYIFGLLTQGTACGIVDFKELYLEAGEAFVVQPGQVHRFVCSDRAEGWLMMIDSKFVGDAEKCILDNFSLVASTFKLNQQREKELRSLALVIEERLKQKDPMSAVLHYLTQAFVSVVAEAVQSVEAQHATISLRQKDIVLSFRSLLKEHIYTNRQPSFYASLLSISTVYLNEVVKQVTGMSTALYIKNEIVLQAKRMLVNTNLSVKQIANDIGFDDCAYFSRLFSKTTGVSPQLFRHKYMD